MAMRQKQLNSSINTSGAPKVAEQAPPMPPSKRILVDNAANFKKSEKPANEKEKSEKSIEGQPDI